LSLWERAGVRASPFRARISLTHSPCARFSRRKAMDLLNARSISPASYNAAMRFRLRTLLILMAAMPPAAAWIWLRHREGELANDFTQIGGKLLFMVALGGSIATAGFAAFHLVDALRRRC